MDLQDERKAIYWDGGFTSRRHDEHYQKAVIALRSENWPHVLEICESDLSQPLVDPLVYTRMEAKDTVDGKWSTVLHQALYKGAPDEVVERLVALGALCSVKDERNALPWQVARKAGRMGLSGTLFQRVPRYSLSDRQIQSVFRRLLRPFLLEAARNVTPVGKIRLPQIITLRETPLRSLWFPIAGMMGGFHCWWEDSAAETSPLVVQAWSRMEGIVMNWLVTTDGARKIDERDAAHDDS